jgi:hypothetical protein
MPRRGVCVTVRLDAADLRFLGRYARECGLATVEEAGEMIVAKLARRLRRKRLRLDSGGGGAV